MKIFLNKSCGRIAAATLAFLLCSAAAISVLEPSGLATGIFLLAPMLGIVGFLFAVGLSVYEAPNTVLVLLLTLPVLGGLYLASITVIAGHGIVPGVILLIAGIAVLSKAIWPPALSN